MKNWTVVCVLLGVSLAACVGRDLAPDVTPESIKAVRLGMSMEEVVSTLGDPYSVETNNAIHSRECERTTDSRLRCAFTDLHDIHRRLDSTFNAEPCCSADREARQRRQVTLLFSRMVGKASPMLWVHLNRVGHVQEVFAKLNSRSAFVDDAGVYLLKWPQVGPWEFDTTQVMRTCEDDLLSRYFSW